MGDMGRAFDGGYAEYALVPEEQLVALETADAHRRMAADEATGKLAVLPRAATD